MPKIAVNLLLKQQVYDNTQATFEKITHVKDNILNSYCGIINVYNFLADSFKGCYLEFYLLFLFSYSRLLLSCQPSTILFHKNMHYFFISVVFQNERSFNIVQRLFQYRSFNSVYEGAFFM